MSFLALADVHLESKLYGIPALGQDLFNLFEQALDKAVELQVEHVIIVGDLFDTNAPAPSTVQFVRDQVLRIRREGIKVFGIAGDHDKPIDNRTWREVCHVYPVDSFPAYAGVDFCHPDIVFNYLVDNPQRHQVEWLFLHGIDTGLFALSTDEHKNLDLNNFDFFELYPKLRGIILGDIHSPLYRTLNRKSRSISVQYCGSLGAVKADETDNKAGLLYWDDRHLTRVSLTLPREFVKLDLTGDSLQNLSVDFYRNKYKDTARPVFRVMIGKPSPELSETLRQLSDVGFVQRIQTKAKADGTALSIIESHLDLNIEEGMGDVLKACCPSAESYELAWQLIQSEEQGTVRETLDQFVMKNVPNSKLMREAPAQHDNEQGN